MTDDSLFLIDVDKILRTKAPKQYKYIPKFVVSYLKKIVHQDEINVFLNESKDKLGVDFLEACMEFLMRSGGERYREPAERRIVYLCVQSPAGRTGWSGSRLCAGAPL